MTIDKRVLKKLEVKISGDITTLILNVPQFSTVKKVSTFELLKTQFRNEARNCNQ